MSLSPDEFLQAFHAAHPGATSQAFADGRDDSGRSSYDLLAAATQPTDSVLDLGCGDGFLLELIGDLQPSASRTGVDMSLGELQAARARSRLAGVPLACAKAQALPLADSAVDYVVSHLAFMLMSDIDVVCDEIARVLKPGGRFATVTGGGPGDGDSFELFLDLFRDVYAASPTKAPRYGDKRTRYGDGIAELFGSRFDAPVESRHTLRLDGPVERVWQCLSTMYECFVLDEAALSGLHARFVGEAGKLPTKDGLVPCTMRVRYVEIRKN